MITYRSDGPVAWATLDRPEKLNAMTRAFWGELVEVLDRVEADPQLRVLILHGAGRCFSVGGDIEGFGELTHAGDRRAYLEEAIASMAMPSAAAASSRSSATSWWPTAPPVSAPPRRWSASSPAPASPAALPTSTCIG